MFGHDRNGVTSFQHHHFSATNLAPPFQRGVLSALYISARNISTPYISVGVGGGGGGGGGGRAFVFVVIIHLSGCELQIVNISTSYISAGGGGGGGGRKGVEHLFS